MISERLRHLYPVLPGITRKHNTAERHRHSGINATQQHSRRRRRRRQQQQHARGTAASRSEWHHSKDEALCPFLASVKRKRGINIQNTDEAHLLVICVWVIVKKAEENEIF